MMSDVAHIAANVARLRLDRQLTQAELAGKAGISRVALGKIERGVVVPRAGTLALLAKTLPVPTGELVTPVRPLESVRFCARARVHAREQILAEVSKWLVAYAGLEADLDEQRPFRFEIKRGSGAVGHIPDGDRVGRLAGAVELQAFGEEEETDLRAGDGVVAVGDGVDDGFVDDVASAGGNGCPSSVCCACIDRRPAPESRSARCRFAAGFIVPPPQIIHHGAQVAIELSGIFFTNAPDFRDDWIRIHCRHP